MDFGTLFLVLSFFCNVNVNVNVNVQRVNILTNSLEENYTGIAHQHIIDY